LLHISRPRFWLYLLGPYMLGGLLGAGELESLADWRYWALFAWFSFPANLLLYGVNDAADYDTDQHNPKKVRDEALVEPRDRTGLLVVVGLMLLLALPVVAVSPLQVGAYWVLFVLLGIAYSVPPVRFKARPGLDSLSNVLYLVPMGAGWAFFQSSFPPATLALAGTLWCAAMHAYSAIPDVESDRRAGLATIATTLGRDGTLAFCAACWAGAAALVLLRDVPSGMMLSAYPLLAGIQLARARARVREWYRYFPIVNALVGMLLTLRVLWPLTVGRP